MNGPRVLMVRFSAIGDCVMAAWAATAIRNSVAGSQVFWAVQDTCSEVIDTDWLAEERLVVDRLSWRSLRWSPTLWGRQFRLFSGLRRHKFDVGFDLQGHSKTALCLRLARPSRRVSHLSTDKFAATLNHQVDVGRDSIHEVEAHHRLVETVFPLGSSRSVKLPGVTSLVSGRPVTIQTGASRVDKRYPIEQWKVVAKKLVTRGYQVVAIGGKHDPHLDLPGVENLVGKLTLAESLGVIQSSRVHLAVDTGTGHVAAAYGVPVVSLFGQTDPVRYQPFGSQCTILKAESPADIPPDDVVESLLMQARGACVS